MLAVVLPVLRAGAAETEPVNAQTPWRVWLVRGMATAIDAKDQVSVPQRNGSLVELTAASARLTTLPPAAWHQRDFDDALCGRYVMDELSDHLGGYGYDLPPNGKRGNLSPIALYLRTRFGVSDPERVADLQVTVEYIGGAVVFVNGVEAGRSHLPSGTLAPYTPATRYPLEAYMMEDGRTPLSPLGANGYFSKPDPKLLPRYQARIRQMTVAVPARVLVKGTNVLSLAVLRAPAFASETWNHLGIRAVKVTSANGAGVIGYAEALKGTRIWNAQPVEQVAARRATSFSQAILGARPLKGIGMANPLDPLTPVRILAPRNGVGNGQVVLSDPAGLTGVRASVGSFRGPDGAVLPSQSVRIWYASQGENGHWCDDLREKALEGTTLVPVWLEARPTKTQPPGWYVSILSLTANGKSFQVPVQVLVSGFVVPDARDFRGLVVAMHSPDAVAKAYQVDMWSEQHFRLMAKSLEMMGQLGNDVMIVPVIESAYLSHKSGLIRWVKTPPGWRHDFSLFGKYMDLYLQYCAPPKAVTLHVWGPESAKDVSDTWKAAGSRATAPAIPLRVTQWDPLTGGTTNIPAPWYSDEGAEAFWKPMLDGVRDAVRKRGWPERIIMLGMGGDTRPSQQTGEIFRKWAPYARWNINSHFVGDPWPLNIPKQGVGEPFKFFAVGGIEVGLFEVPAGQARPDYSQLNIDFLFVNYHRWNWHDGSGPAFFRSYPIWGACNLSRVGVDCWPKVAPQPGRGTPMGTIPYHLSCQDTAGASPTVRLQLLREGLQDYETRLTIERGLSKLPAEQQKKCGDLLGDLNQHLAGGVLPQMEHSFDWPGCVARVYRAAEEVTGVKAGGTWEQPPQ